MNLNGTSKGVCAITGANGYLGRCLKGFFANRGWQVLELTRQPRSGVRAESFHLGADVSPKCLEGVDALIHCAYDFAPLRWCDIQAVNIAGAQKLLQAARDAGIKRTVCISSISAYEGCRSLYGRAKLEIEALAFQHAALVVRPGLIYGDNPEAMFGRLVHQVRQLSLIPIIGDGSQIQYLLHNEDLGNFLELYAAGLASPADRLITAAHEQPWPFRHLLSAIAVALGKHPVLIRVPWRAVWLGLKTAELCGLQLAFRSDSVVSLNYQNPAPDFAPAQRAGLVCRAFQPESLKL